MEFDIFKPGDKAWYWGLGCMKDGPVEITIDSISIYSDEYTTAINYQFKEKIALAGSARSYDVFPTYEEASEYKQQTVQVMRDGLAGLKVNTSEAIN